MTEDTQEKRALICPHVPPLDVDPSVTHPLSFRMYQPLLPVDPQELAVAAAIADDETRVMTPIGGVLLPGHLAGSEEEQHIVIDDIMAVPKEQGVALANNIPLMVFEQPPFEHINDGAEDFGVYPTARDVSASAMNTAKETEMVLALPAESFVSQAINALGNGSPNLLHDEIYSDLSFVRRDWCEKDTRFIQLLPYIVFYKKVNGKFYIFVYQRGKGAGEQRLAMGCSIGVGGHINPHDFLSTQFKTVALTAAELGPELAAHIQVGTAFESQSTGRVLAEGFWTGVVNNVKREIGEEVEILEIGEPGSDGELFQGRMGRVVDIEEFIGQAAQQEGMSPEAWLHARTAFFLDYQAGDVEKVHLAMFIGIELPDNFAVSTNEEALHDVGFIELSELAADAPWATPTALECWSRSIIDSLGDTLKFAEANPDIKGFGSKFVQKVMVQDGIHPADAEEIAKIPPADRWKIGTISQIFGSALRFYAMNAYIRA